MFSSSSSAVFICFVAIAIIPSALSFAIVSPSSAAGIKGADPNGMPIYASSSLYGDEKEEEDIIITRTQLERMFPLDDDNIRMENSSKFMGSPKLLQNAKKHNFDYDHVLTRDKFLPMAAAAYGSPEMVKKCLNKTFQQNYELHVAIEVPCNGHQRQKCSGFVAISHMDKAIIMAFRGTSSKMQLTMETSRILFNKQADSPLGGKVALYFIEIFQQLVEKGLIQEVLTLTSKYPDYQIWISGHSLGGALASLAAAELYSSNKEAFGGEIEKRIKLATFGQPRTGNAEWANAMDRAFPHYNYRIINQRDVVAHIPIRGFQNYRHFMSEVWYKNGMENVDQNGYVICDGMDEDDKNCSNSLWTYSILHHMYYFGHRVDHYGKNGCEDDK